MQEVLLLIGMEARSGELVLESGNNIGSIIFHAGRIVQAFSPYSRAIGDLLVEDGVISESELLEMLHQQKKRSAVPIGAMFLQTGKVSFEKLEMMIHEQIRNSLKDFMVWQKLNISFVDREIRPFDRICLPVHEFIASDVLKSAQNFFSLHPTLTDTAATASTKTL